MMSTRIRYWFFSLTAFVLFASGCQRCRDCYLVEEKDGAKQQTFIGEKCGVEIKTLENDRLRCLSDSCYYTCP